MQHPWLAVLRRRGKLGDSLVSALEHFIDNERISPDLALKVLAEVRCHLPACCLSLMPTGSCCVLSVVLLPAV